MIDVANVCGEQSVKVAEEVMMGAREDDWIQHLYLRCTNSETLDPASCLLHSGPSNDAVCMYERIEKAPTLQSIRFIKFRGEHDYSCSMGLLSTVAFHEQLYSHTKCI